MNETMNVADNLVVSSRVRFARNVNGFNFPHKLDNESAYGIMKKTYDVLGAGNYKMRVIAQMSEVERGAYVERHLISPALAESDRIGAVLVSGDERISVMLNEEDHIRAQCIENGFNLPKAFAEINKIDFLLSRSINVAYDGNLGFLTCCPTNLGTGMRASVMIFLPMLTLNSEMDKAAAALTRRYITVRGSYGEGSNAGGYMYQISNQASLGVSEEEIISAVTSAATTVCEEEFRFLLAHYDKNRAEFTDTVFRARGVLTSAYMLSSAEFTELFVSLKLGVVLGLIKCRDLNRLNKLSEQILPNNLLLLAGRPLNEAERDLFRAEYVKKELKENLI